MILYVDEDHANTNDSEWNYVNMNDEGTHLGHYTIQHLASSHLGDGTHLFHDTLPHPPNTLKVE